MPSASSLSLLLLLFCALKEIFCAAVLPETTNQGILRIDCGSNKTTGIWGPDKYFESGVRKAINSNFLTFQKNPELATLREFTNGSSPCYVFQVEIARYIVKLSFLYGNYDGKNSSPKFLVYINGQFLEQINFLDNSTTNPAPYFTEYVLLEVPSIAVCFVKGVGNPIVNSIEIVPLNTGAYVNSDLRGNFTLLPVLRVNCAGPPINGTTLDAYDRVWREDLPPNSTNSFQVSPRVEVSTSHYNSTFSGIAVSNSGLNSPPDNIPSAVFETARTGNSLVYYLNISGASLIDSWMVRMYFAETERNVSVGERLFDVFAGSGISVLGVQNYDIMADVGFGYSSNVTIIYQPAFLGGTLELFFGCSKNRTSLKPALLNGFEVLAVIPYDENVGTPPVDTPSTDFRQPTISSSGRKSVVGIVVGSVVGIVVLSLIIIGAVVWYRRSRSAPAQSEGINLTSARYDKSDGGVFTG